MRPFLVVVLDVIADGAVEHGGPEEDHLAQALGFDRVWRGPGDVDGPARQVHDEQGVVGDEPPCRPDLRREEVRRDQDLGMGTDEAAPAAGAVWRGLDAVLAQRLGHGAACDLVPDVLEPALDARVAPARVVQGHAHDERADVGHQP